jgi:transcriptional regulator with XRE-family HTH domain
MAKGHELLKKWRERAGLTQRKLAEALDTDAPAISRWESGGLPSLMWAARIERLTKGAVPCNAWMPEA